MPAKFPWIRNVYLYLVCAITLFMIAFAAVDLINLGLRTWIFTKADTFDYGYPTKTPDAYCAFDKNGNRTCPNDNERQRLEENDKKQQEENRIARRQTDLVRNISMLIVAIPLFTYHWIVIRRDRKENQE